MDPRVQRTLSMYSNVITVPKRRAWGEENQMESCYKFSNEIRKRVVVSAKSILTKTAPHMRSLYPSQQENRKYRLVSWWIGLKSTTFDTKGETFTLSVGKFDKIKTLKNPRIQEVMDIIDKQKNKLVWIKSG